jgi:RHS repeat-associated protein
MQNIALKQRLFYRKKLKKFTVKELDPETGLYYYGARYLDPKTSRWLSGDPAMGEYLPVAPVNDEAKKRNGNLPGQGGVFNYVNLHAYHYAGNNPVKYTDPDGRIGRQEGEAKIEKIISSIDSILNTIWKNSFLTDGNVEEWGGAVSINNGRYVSHGIKTDHNSINVKINTDKSTIAVFHTHPYSRAENGYTGVGFTDDDIISLQISQTNISIVEAGTKRFVVEVVDRRKFNAFSKDDISKIWNEAWKKALDNGLNMPDSIKEAVKAVVNHRNSGLKVYESIDKEKLKFEELK